jgi:hypothetical protein
MTYENRNHKDKLKFGQSLPAHKATTPRVGLLRCTVIFLVCLHQKNVPSPTNPYCNCLLIFILLKSTAKRMLKQKI